MRKSISVTRHGKSGGKQGVRSEEGREIREVEVFKPGLESGVGKSGVGSQEVVGTKSSTVAKARKLLGLLLGLRKT